MTDKRPGGGPTATQQVAKFVGVSALAGAVLAGLALPAAGALGLVAKNSAEGFDEIPADLKRPPLSQKTTILDAEGGQIASVYFRDRTVIPLRDMSPYIKKAIVAIEDARFYRHGAVDLKGILRAANRNAQEGGVQQGASTLTQQYVKNVFVEDAGTDENKVAEATQQTVGRKIKELKYAIQVEKELGKKQILENYLNITFFGQQAYGVEAAAKRYFSKPAKELKLEEAALLAGLVQSPSRFDPLSNETEATKRRNVVLQRMADTGAVTQERADRAKRRPLGLSISKPRNGCITAVNGAGFFCDYVREAFLRSPEFGKSREARVKRWTRGGMTIRTTLDPQAQESVQRAIRRHVYQSDPVATAVSLVEPGTGKILGMGQSRPYGFKGNQTTLNLSVDNAMGGGVGYQPGSTIKAFTAAAALEKGMSPGQSYASPYRMPYPSATDCDGNRYPGTGSVPNENKSEVGPYRMPEALQKSINTYFVSLQEDAGLCEVTKLMSKLGMDKRAGGTDWGLGPSFTLGVNEASPLSMAAAYAAFANRGVYCAPNAITAVTDAGGKELRVPEGKCTEAMSKKTADTINTMLKGVVDDGTGRQAGLPNRETAGKTGTTDSRFAAWYVGYTPNMAGAVWMGDPKRERQMRNITIGGRYQKKVYGASGPAPIWKDAVSGALEGHPSERFHTVPLPKDKAGKRGGDRKDKPGRSRLPKPDFTLPSDVLGGGWGNGKPRKR
ncbi:transglycosylase domain-containing protein [Streptomyces meridianus]|uniref:Penicillin-binding protein n=1 Tax=Streptomyces meridianus TaxID=2938945 RepID=A0ABT0X7N3_9ACTN|nr:transglycosylase domain-containing protein [Streptomyces meridianus]MCM2577727.1 penicillin-binding protein [Streptomyces meridianus]